MTPPASVEPVAWGLRSASGSFARDNGEIVAIEARDMAEEYASSWSERYSGDGPYRVVPLYAADVPALMARIERAEGRSDRMVETLRDAVRPYIVARGTDPIYWGANVLSMIDDILDRAREGA